MPIQRNKKFNLLFQTKLNLHFVNNKNPHYLHEKMQHLGLLIGVQSWKKLFKLWIIQLKTKLYNFIKFLSRNCIIPAFCCKAVWFELCTTIHFPLIQVYSPKTFLSALAHILCTRILSFLCNGDVYYALSRSRLIS